MSIERLSMAAYILPFSRATSPKLAGATDGAAENRPAKLLGFKASPNAANRQTTEPQSKNATRIA